MPKVALIQQNFNGGEYSQGVKQRTDLQFYYNGGELYRNFFPTKEGNAKFRNGLYFERITKSDKKTVLIPFVSSSDNRFVLEFSDLVLRVFKDDVQVGTDIVSPYREEDLFNIEYAQEKSIMIIVDGVHPPYRLTGTTAFTLALESFDYSVDSKVPPLLSENLTAITITPSATTGTITLTASAAVFDALDIGRYVKIRDSGTGNFGFIRITVFTSTTLVTGVVVKTLPGTAAYTTWSFSMLPAGVTFYEQRLIYGQFNKTVFSKTPDDNGIVRYNDFTLGTAVDDAMQYESGLLKGNVQWLIATDRMIAIGTYTGIFKADSGNTNDSISPENPPTIKQISAEGTTNVMPIQKDNVVFFLSRDTKRVLTLQYNFDADGFIITDKMLLSDEMAEEGITQLSYKLGDENILYATKNNGELVGMIHNPQQEINGWFRIETDGEVESVVSLPNSAGKDRVYTVVKRTINSATKRHIEYFTEDIVLPKRNDYYTGDKDTDDTNWLFDMWEAQKDFNFLDASSIYDGSIQTVTMTPAATTGLDITFTASGVLFNAATDIGRQIWEKSGTGRAIITSYISTTQVKCNIISDFASISALAAGNWYFTGRIFAGLGYLEGKEVKVIRDGGRDEGTYTITGGILELVQTASKLTVGLPYTGTFKSMPLEGGSPDGASQGKSKMIDKMALYFLNSIGCKVGTDPYKLNTVLFGPGYITGRPITAYSGFKKLDLSERYEEEKHIYVIQDTPLPCIIQSIVPLREANDE